MEIDVKDMKDVFRILYDPIFIRNYRTRFSFDNCNAGFGTVCEITDIWYAGSGVCCDTSWLGESFKIGEEAFVESFKEALKELSESSIKRNNVSVLWDAEKRRSNCQSFAGIVQKGLKNTPKRKR